MNTVDLALLKTIPETCPAYQARATARAITRYYNACFRPYELTAEQFSLLVGIGGGVNETVAEIGRASCRGKSGELGGRRVLKTKRRQQVNLD